VFVVGGYSSVTSQLYFAFVIVVDKLCRSKFKFVYPGNCGKEIPIAFQKVYLRKPH